LAEINVPADVASAASGVIGGGRSPAVGVAGVVSSLFLRLFLRLFRALSDLPMRNRNPVVGQ
jgi:hypothetical protein